MRLRTALALATLSGFLFLPGAHASPVARVFAKVPAPGHADTSVLLPDGSVLVSTNRAAMGTVGPSKLFRYSARGALVRTYSIRGQDLAHDHGTMSMALDAKGRVYVADYAPPRVLRIDLKSGAQSTYATVPDLPLSSDNGIPTGPRPDAQPWPDGLAFMKGGQLLVTDLGQGTVFIVANGGGPAKVWLQGPELRSTFGPNQAVMTPAGDLLLDVTASTMPTTVGSGVLYRIRLDARGRPGLPVKVYATRPGEGPDGFALGVSGKVYVPMLVTNRIAVANPDGTEAASITDSTFDSPSSVTFLGTDILVTNLTYFTGDASHDLVLRLPVGDRGVAALRPAVRR